VLRKKLAGKGKQEKTRVNQSPILVQIWGRAVATSYILSIITMWGLAAILSGKFKAISGRISQAVKDTA